MISGLLIDEGTASSHRSAEGAGNLHKTQDSAISRPPFSSRSATSSCGTATSRPQSTGSTGFGLAHGVLHSLISHTGSVGKRRVLQNLIVSGAIYFTEQQSRGIAVSEYESLCQRKDGTKFPVSATGSTLVNPDGEVVPFRLSCATSQGGSRRSEPALFWHGS
jgi:hypothetical protein